MSNTYCVYILANRSRGLYTGMGNNLGFMLQLRPKCREWYDWKTNTLHGCSGT